ncbi:unnamed protein product [Sphagnum jensenii]|uniref:BHLH domain-containing protein n=1 Tax=Sphagnum jensenii TaxID=128206 RepID=A0ABP0WST1_9BRYO
MMAYMGAAVASELPSSSAYTTLQQQLQRSISIPASTYSSSAMSILQLTDCIDSKLLNLSTAPRRPWSSLEKASCGISVEPTKGALALQGVGLATSHCLEQFSSDPAFAERAAKFSSFSNNVGKEDTMTMTTTTTTTTKSATFKDILASERSSSENSGDESLSPGSTRVAGNKNKKNKQQHGTLHPSTMKNKVKVLQQQPPCSEPTTSCKQDYVHVRARRGQATDSHSLAERVRREKISERMKYLQDLVPGCTKVTGKAVMLDEIINYVQSLQQQVEFLSMKLASVNPPLDYNLDTILNREMLHSGASSLLGLEPSSNYWLHQTPLIQQPITTDPEHFSSLGTIDGHHLRRTFSAPTRVPSASSVDAFGDDTTQISTGWDGELQSILQMGFAQTGRQLAAGHMKVEL